MLNFVPLTLYFRWTKKNEIVKKSVSTNRLKYVKIEGFPLFTVIWGGFSLSLD